MQKDTYRNYNQEHYYFKIIQTISVVACVYKHEGTSI